MHPIIWIFLIVGASAFLVSLYKQINEQWERAQEIREMNLNRPDPSHIKVAEALERNCQIMMRILYAIPIFAIIILLIVLW